MRLIERPLWPWVLLIVGGGFLMTTLLSYWIAIGTIRQTLASQIVPLTGETITAEMSRDIMPPLLIAQEMAHNTFLRDWLLSEEHNQEVVVKYLQSIKARHKVNSVFLISDVTNNYYHTTGLLKPIEIDDPTDSWYLQFKRSGAPYNISMNLDARNDSINVFVDHRIIGKNGEFIGVTGVGIKSSNMLERIASYEQKYNSRIYFFNASGELVLASYPVDKSDHSAGHQRLKKMYQKLTEQKNGRPSFVYSYLGNVHQVYSKYIPELRWHLVVDKSEQDLVAPLQRVTFVNVLISVLSTALVSAMLFPRLRSFQKHLENAANTDVLTGLSNRYHFDRQFSKYLEQSDASTAFTLILVDIDYFKKINDDFGHLEGDEVLKSVGQVLQRTVRKNDIVSRWGGEEFIILLKDCSHEHAEQIAHKLCETVAAHSFHVPRKITVSCGVASATGAESEDEILMRADRALYRAKEAGRDRIEVG